MINTNNLHLQYLTNTKGKQTAVVLPINEFNELMEDIEDLMAINSRQHEDTISHENLLKELASDGLL